jgi:hypothetical protein
MFNATSVLDGFFRKQPKLRKVNMMFGTSDVRCLYRAGLLLTVSKELSKCKLDSAGVQEVTPNKKANVHFSMERGMKIMN